MCSVLYRVFLNAPSSIIYRKNNRLSSFIAAWSDKTNSCGREGSSCSWISKALKLFAAFSISLATSIGVKVFKKMFMKT